MELLDSASEGCCCICLGDLVSKGVQSLSCGHTFHEDCIREMRKIGASGRCPLCRETSDELTPLQAMVDKAAAFHTRGSYKECAQLASAVLDIDPLNIDMSCLLSKLLFFGMGVPRDSERACEILEAHGEQSSAIALVQLARLYMRQGRDSEADDLCQKARQLGNPKASTLLGELYMKQGRDSEAEELFQQGHQLGDAHASTMLGDLYMKQGRDSEAEELFQQGRQLGDAWASTSLGTLYMHQGRDSEAEELLQQGHQLGDTWASTMLGKLYMKQGRDSEAEELLQQGIQLGKTEASTMLGELYMKQGRDSEAEELFQQGRQLGDTWALTMLGKLYMHQGRDSEAEELLQQGHQLGDTWASTMRGKLYMKQGRYSEAGELLQQGIQLGNAEASTLLGELYMKQGRYSEAGELFQRARQLGDPVASTLLGTLYMKQGRYSEAEELFQQGRQLGHQEASTLLGMLYMNQGRDAEAVELLKHDPGAMDIACKLHGMLCRSLGRNSKTDSLHASDKAIRSAQVQESTGDVTKMCRNGQPVRICGLASWTGQSLNGLVGTVCCHSDESDRIGVEIAGKGRKSIKRDNLQTLDVSLRQPSQASRAPNASSIQQVLDDRDEAELDLAVQAAIEASVLDAPAMQSFATVTANQNISETLHQSRIAAEAGKYVVHLRFSRPCQALNDVLLKSGAPEALVKSHRDLEAAGYKVELESGLKLFVTPEMYEAVLAAIQGQALKSRDVIVAPELENTVIQLVNGLKKSNKVYHRRSQGIPLGFLLTAQKESLQISWSKRSISIKVPSSLRSSSSSADGPKTV